MRRRHRCNGLRHIASYISLQWRLRHFASHVLPQRAETLCVAGTVAMVLDTLLRTYRYNGDGDTLRRTYCRSGQRRPAPHVFLRPGFDVLRRTHRRIGPRRFASHASLQSKRRLFASHAFLRPWLDVSRPACHRAMRILASRVSLRRAYRCVTRISASCVSLRHKNLCVHKLSSCVTRILASCVSLRHA